MSERRARAASEWETQLVAYLRAVLLRKAVRETEEARIQDPDAPLPEWVREWRRKPTTCGGAS